MINESANLRKEII